MLNVELRLAYSFASATSTALAAAYKRLLKVPKRVDHPCCDADVKSF